MAVKRFHCTASSFPPPENIQGKGRWSEVAVQPVAEHRAEEEARWESRGRTALGDSGHLHMEGLGKED